MLQLDTAPIEIKQYKEIITKYAANLTEHYNKLSKEERILIYYLFRASLPGNRIAADQMHRNCLEITDIFETILKNEELLNKKYAEFVDQSKIYLVYLWSNHSNYFKREDALNKRTPKKVGLNKITKENLIEILTYLDIKNANEIIEKLEKTIFDTNYEPTLTVSDDIESSAVNFYSRNFTQQDYELLSKEERCMLNAYFSKDEQTGKISINLYSAKDKYAQELSVSAFWLDKAHKFALNHTEHFDKHFIKSLEYLIQFILTGDEKYFKLHSIEWLQSNSKVDYIFGFIESYDDPKKVRATFQAEATIKTIDINILSSILPNIEKQLPFPLSFKRTEISVPNASINCQVFGTGDLGPDRNVLAYCLPNYEDIRAENGSKQIIYQIEKDTGELLNPKLFRELSYLADQIEWLNRHDVNHEFINDLDNIQTILHETIGHASGKLDLLPEQDAFLGSNDMAIEELRAEIIAMYVSVYHIDEIIKTGMLDKWKNLITKEEFISWFIIVGAKSGLTRLLRQPEEANEIMGDYPIANQTILNYLVDNGGLEIIKEEHKITTKNYVIPGIVISDLALSLELIKKLMIEVQTIKSTADKGAAEKLLSTYGKRVRDRNLIKILKENSKEIIGDVKASAYIYPKFNPVFQDNGNQIIDIKATWPKSIFEQHLYYNEIALLKI